MGGDRRDVGRVIGPVRLRVGARRLLNSMTPENARPVPEWLRGLWRRRSIEYADGRRDDTTIVYWLQTESAFADIRIPVDRPDVRGRVGLEALSTDELTSLAGQAGFAGWTELDGDLCQWHRTIDYQPPTGVPDEGRLRLENGVLIEEGVHERYVEVWEPIGCGPGRFGVMARPPSEAARREVLITWGDVFMFARPRDTALPRAASLAELLNTAPRRSTKIAPLLDCEISFGYLRGGSVPWEVRLSTLPFREGNSGFARGDRATVHAR